jgi:hypothetical protein
MHLNQESSAATGLVLGESKCLTAPPRLQVKSSSNALVVNTPVWQSPASSLAIPAPLPPTATSNGLLRPYHVSAFWCAFDTPNLSLQRREDNFTHLTLFTFDIVHSLNEQEKDFLIHARLAHLRKLQTRARQVAGCTL